MARTASITVGVPLTVSQYHAIKEYAARKGVPMAAALRLGWLERAVAEYEARHPS